jgi:putative PIN family toxin of toxin-antitoxin system
MKVVLDTNVLLVAISDRSPFHWVFEYLREGKFVICFTTDMLEEYEEIIGRHLGPFVAGEVISGLLQLPNHEKVEKFYYWNLIPQDPDDNKFVDCAIACNASFIVSEDKHFDVVKRIDFPAIEVVSIQGFREKFD